MRSTSSRPAIPDEVAASLSPEIREALTRTWVQSGTAARLARAGLVSTSASVPAGIPSLGEAARFGASSQGSPVQAAVLFFMDWELMAPAGKQLASAGLRHTQNGAYLVVLSADCPEPLGAEILQAVAGEE